MRELQPIRSVDEERGREGGGGQEDGQAGGEEESEGARSGKGGGGDHCNKCREDLCLTKGNSRVVKTIRWENLTFSPVESEPQKENTEILCSVAEQKQ